MLEELKSHAEERLGLHLSSDRLLELHRFVAERARAERTTSEPELVDFLNGETYFFRYPFFLSLLRGRLESSLSQPFRLLCPACSTGEEAYSVAFALADAARHLGRRVEILGADIRPKAVRQAREGVYGVWSLRNTPLAERAKHFEPVPESRFRVREEFRSLVRFTAHNLLDPFEDGLFDAVVLCNATLYMHPAAAQTAYANVAASLKADGLLLIAPTDPPPTAAAFRHCPEYSGWSVYRPAGTPSGPRAPSAWERLSNLPLPGPLSLEPAAATGSATPARALPRKAARRREKPAPRRAPRQAGPGSNGPQVSLWSVQPDDVEIWSAWSAGRLQAVEPKIRHKVFFEPDNPLWRFLRGAVLWEQGWLRRAKKEIERAGRLLELAPPEAAVSGLCSAVELRRVIDEWSTQHG